MEELLKEIKEQLDLLEISNIDFNQLTEESLMVLKVDTRQFLFKLKHINKNLKNETTRR